MIERLDARICNLPRRNQLGVRRHRRRRRRSGGEIMQSILLRAQLILHLATDDGILLAHRRR